MRFILTIECDTPAFQPSPSLEISRILDDISSKVLDPTSAKPYSDDIPALDANRNVVGAARIEP